jgi:hypothetical protein
MKKSTITLAVLALVIIVAVITNPKLEDHKAAIKSKMNAAIQKSMSETISQSNDGLQQAGSVLGVMLGGALIDRLIDSAVGVDNYVLFSLTKVTWEGNSMIVGVGIFGNVFLVSAMHKSLARGLNQDKINP